MAVSLHSDIRRRAESAAERYWPARALDLMSTGARRPVERLRGGVKDFGTDDPRGRQRVLRLRAEETVIAIVGPVVDPVGNVGVRLETSSTDLCRHGEVHLACAVAEPA